MADAARSPLRALQIGGLRLKEDVAACLHLEPAVLAAELERLGLA